MGAKRNKPSIKQFNLLPISCYLAATRTQSSIFTKTIIFSLHLIFKLVLRTFIVLKQALTFHHALQDDYDPCFNNLNMTSFKSPELIVTGKIVKVVDTSNNQDCSFYVKAKVFEGQNWKLLSGKNKFESFQSEAINNEAALQQPFNLQYTTMSMRGWPRMLLEVWRVDEYGRHSIYGYGTATFPMASGSHSLQVPCWRPMGTWYDRFIGAHSQLQYPDIVASSLSKYGLRTMSGCVLTIDLDIIGRNFQLHGVLR